MPQHDEEDERKESNEKESADNKQDMTKVCVARNAILNRPDVTDLSCFNLCRKYMGTMKYSKPLEKESLPWFIEQNVNQMVK